MKETLNQIWWGNTVLSYLLVVGGMLLTWILWRTTRRWLIGVMTKITAKTDSKFDDLIVEAADKYIIPYVYLVVNLRIIKQLTLSPKLEQVLSVAALLVTTYIAVRLVIFCIQHLVTGALKARNEPEQRIKQVQGMLLVVKALIWCAGIVMLIDNLGYNVTTIIAGLGVGGIAIALAAQNILADLFSYIVIFFDKPFEIGDFISTKNHSGVVEKIGIKTSHLRSPDGQQLVMPNTEMVKDVIQNFKRLEKRRVLFSIGVVYTTASDLLRRIPDMVKEIIDKEEKAQFDRAHFKSFGDFAINFEIVYFITTADYVLYMDTHQRICLQLFDKFQQLGIEFAYPTQTLYLNGVQQEDGSVLTRN